MNADWRNRYEAAVAAAEEAGRLALGYFPDAGPGRCAVEWKQDHSPVTVADREAETFLRTTLRKAFPGDGFLGEEFGDEAGTSGYRWVIDPIDGTRNFVRGIPIWGTLVALEYQGEPVAGVARLPVLGHTYHALRGGGAYRGDCRIRVSDVAALDQAVMFYSSLSWFTKAGRAGTFLDLASRVQRQRGFGDFYGFVLVAQGSGDFMMEYGVHAWDVAALRVLVEEAGGRFTDWKGTPTHLTPDVLASNGRLHDDVLKVLSAEC